MRSAKNGPSAFNQVQVNDDAQTKPTGKPPTQYSPRTESKLEAFYETHRFPKRQEKTRLAEETGLDVMKIQDWFKIRRRRDLRQTGRVTCAPQSYKEMIASELQHFYTESHTDAMMMHEDQDFRPAFASSATTPALNETPSEIFGGPMLPLLPLSPIADTPRHLSENCSVLPPSETFGGPMLPLLPLSPIADTPRHLSENCSGLPPLSPTLSPVRQNDAQWQDSSCQTDNSDLFAGLDSHLGLMSLLLPPPLSPIKDCSDIHLPSPTPDIVDLAHSSSYGFSGNVSLLLPPPLSPTKDCPDIHLPSPNPDIVDLAHSSSYGFTGNVSDYFAYKRPASASMDDVSSASSSCDSRKRSRSPVSRELFPSCNKRMRIDVSSGFYELSSVSDELNSSVLSGVDLLDSDDESILDIFKAC